MCLLPISNAITILSGANQQKCLDGVDLYEDRDKQLQAAFEMKDISRCGIIIAIQLMEAFVFRSMDVAGTMVQQFQEFFDLHECVLVQFSSIYCTF